VSEISHDVPDSDGTRPKRTNGPALLVRMDEDLHSLFAVCCEADGVPMAAVARLAILQYVENHPAGPLGPHEKETR
jgi:hypothetical protein